MIACTNFSAYFFKLIIHPLTFYLLYLSILRSASNQSIFKPSTTNFLFQKLPYFSFCKTHTTQKPFRFFLTQLIMLIYVPIMFTIVSYKKLRTNDIQPEMEDFSKCKFAFMALLDVIHVTMVTVSGGIIPAPLTVLLLQGAVPATMFTTRFFLGHRYTWKHYIGSFLLLLGMCIHMIPMFESVTKNTTTNNAAQMEFFTTTTTSVNTTNISSSSSIDLLHSNSTVILPTETDVLWNCLIYFMCCVPGALSAIYKEYALQTQPMDMYYLNLWVTFFQFVISIPLVRLKKISKILKM